MSFPIQVTFRNLDKSDSLDEYTRKKADKLSMYSEKIARCRVTLEAPHRHSTHGTHYSVRISMTIPGHEIVVNSHASIDKSSEDLYATIDAAFEDAATALSRALQRQKAFDHDAR